MNPPPDLLRPGLLPLVALAALALALGAAVALLLAARRRDGRARDAARERQDRLLRAAEAAGLGLWEWSVRPDGVWMCPGFLGLLGPGADAGAGADRAGFLSLVHPDDRVALRRALAALTPASPRLAIELRVVAADGSERVLDCRGEARFERAGDALFSSLVGACLDVTGRRRDETARLLRRDELAHQGRVALLGELAASLAHEISQPLSAILANADAARLHLARPAPDLGEIRDALDDTAEAARRADGIVRRLRALLKKAPPEPRPVPPAALVDDTLALLRADFARRGVSAEAALPAGLPAVRADPVQAQQILLNLLVNAADALADVPALERVIVVRGETRATPAGERVRLLVEDRGPGLPPERLAKLFQPFESSKPHGLGVGLSLSRSLAEAQGGSLTLANRACGRGAVATLELPTAAGPTRPAA